MHIIIRFVTTTGIHYITPIEFEALGGKEANWKKHVRVTENNKVVKTEIFDKGLVKTCPKGCGCNNCEIARQLPNNLEKLLEIVYSPRKDQSGKSTAISRASLQMVEQSNTSPSTLPAPKSSKTRTSSSSLSAPDKVWTPSVINCTNREGAGA